MNKALIIIDIQNDYFENGAMRLYQSEEAVEKAELILEYFRKNNLPIIHIQHIGISPDATFFLPETKGAEIYYKVQPKETEKVIIKHYPNSFRETELLDYLKTNKIIDLVITGMMTHMCVDATTRAAKDFGFNCTVIGDACATIDIEVNGVSVKAPDVQTAFLGALNYFYSTVITAESFLKENK